MQAARAALAAAANSGDPNRLALRLCILYLDNDGSLNPTATDFAGDQFYGQPYVQDQKSNLSYGYYYNLPGRPETSYLNGGSYTTPSISPSFTTMGEPSR